MTFFLAYVIQKMIHNAIFKSNNMNCFHSLSYFLIFLKIYNSYIARINGLSSLDINDH